MCSKGCPTGSRVERSSPNCLHAMGECTHLKYDISSLTLLNDLLYYFIISVFMYINNDKVSFVQLVASSAKMQCQDMFFIGYQTL